MTNLPLYTELLNKNKSNISFIVGCGTSICNLDLSENSPIHNHMVLTTNSGILALPWQKGLYKNRYWISNDSSVMKWDYWNKVKRSKSIKIVRNSWFKFYNELDSYFYEFWPRSTSEDIIDSKEQGLAYCSSVPSCIDFSIQSGCKKIFLLGVDQYRDQGKSHFWQRWPTYQQPKRFGSSRPNEWDSQKNVFVNYNNKAYKTLNKFAKSEGCKIYNCNIKSKVEYFNKISFEKALNMISE